MIPPFIVLLCVSLLSGCAVYRYEHVTADGVATRLSIYSLREVQAGDIHIDPNGALTGGADQLGTDERMLETLNHAISKIP